MCSFALTGLRQLTALFLAVGLALSTGEQLIPEFHDGDAAVALPAASDVVPDDPVPAPHHRPDTAHVCHCIHVHGVSVASAPGEVPIRDHLERVMGLDTDAPLTLRLPPALRPPIA